MFGVSFVVFVLTLRVLIRYLHCNFNLNDFSNTILGCLWSSGQSFWLQIQRSRVRFPALPDFLSSKGLERGPLSLVRSIEDLLE